MIQSIHKLDDQTSSSIHAGLLYPTLTSIVVALARQSFQAAQVSCIVIRIHLEPEWQISCHDDAKSHRTSGNLFWKEIEDTPLSFLAYLGILDVQRGLRKHVQSGDNVIFSGLVNEGLSGRDMLSSSITVRDVFRALPIRRKHLSNSSTVRTELEACRRAVAIISTAYPDVQVTLSSVLSEEEREVELLFAARRSSISSRYQQLLSLPVDDPKYALKIDVCLKVKETHIKIGGFVIRTLLASRTHQHVIIDGAMEELDDGAAKSSRGNIKSIIQDLLHDSLLGDGKRRKTDMEGHRQYGFFLHIDTGNADLHKQELCKSVRASLHDILTADELTLNKVSTSSKRLEESVVDQVSLKRIRKQTDVPLDNVRLKGRSDFAVSLDRSHLRREHDARRSMSPAPDWLTETLDRYHGKQYPDESKQQAIHSTIRSEIYGSKEDSHSISVEDLRRSYAIGQVDAKFICINKSGNVLALIDQHAAHERIRLEAILSDYVDDCMSQSNATTRAKDSVSHCIDISDGISALYKDESMREFLEFWGFGYHFEEQRHSPMLRFHTIPGILVSKLRQQSVLTSLLVDLASCLDTNGIHRKAQRLRSAIDFNKHTNLKREKWLFAQRYLPTPILDLFNSISCRGAIMFNDPLSLSQCDTIISQLATTTFPFQCAHGRPSLIPLCNLPTQSTWSTSAIDWTAFA